jgi:hypothetical protein
MAVTFAESQDDADPQNPAYRRASHFLAIAPFPARNQRLVLGQQNDLNPRVI